MKSKIIKTFNEPTDIVICGDEFLIDDIEYDLNISDMKALHALNLNDKIIKCKSSNHLKILSYSEFVKKLSEIKYKEKLEFDRKSFVNGIKDLWSSFIIKNFIGDLVLKISVDALYVDIDSVNLNMNLMDEIPKLDLVEEYVPYSLDIHLDIKEHDFEILDIDFYDRIFKIRKRKEILKAI